MLGVLQVCQCLTWSQRGDIFFGEMFIPLIDKETTQIIEDNDRQIVKLQNWVIPY